MGFYLLASELPAFSFANRPMFLSCHLITSRSLAHSPRWFVSWEGGAEGWGERESKGFVVHIFIPAFAEHCLLCSRCLMCEEIKEEKNRNFMPYILNKFIRDTLLFSHVI